MNKHVIFITGATGFIGSHLTRFFSTHQYEVHLLSRKTSDYSRIQDVLNTVHIHIATLEEKNVLRTILKKIKPDYIFHLANEGLYGGKDGESKTVINTNFVGTINLLEASADIPYKLFINTGSSSEYGPSDHRMKEIDPVFPQSVYAISKLGSTLFARSFALQNNKPVVTLRIFSPFGPNDEKTRLIPTVITSALANKPIELANPLSVRDFIYVEDVVRAYLSCIQSGQQLSGEVINIGSGKQHTTSEVVEKIISITNSKSKVRWNKVKPRPYESAVWQADISKAKKLLSWKPHNSFEEGFKKTIQSYRELSSKS